MLPNLGTIEKNPLGYAAWFFVGVGFDRNIKDSFERTSNFSDGSNCNPSPDPGIGKDRGGKANTIQTIIDSHANTTPDLEGLGYQVAQQRQS